MSFFFGFSVGRESLGIYSSGNARGFSPTAAGNVRINGLYFDPGTAFAFQAGLPSPLLGSISIKVGLSAQGDARVRRLSRGQQQRLTIARALLHDPPILLLDEPDTGLDLQAFAALERLLLGDRTVLLTTHNLRQAARLCDRFALLDAGRLVHAAPLQPGDEAALEGTYRRLTVDERPTAVGA